MILEHALLHIKPGQGKAFEASFAEARKIIEAAKGFRKIEVRACIEVPDRYLLLVWWDSVDDHMVGFRQSPALAQWRALTAPFYVQLPEVTHFEAPI
ncbi:MAG TPA: antibiotic biosynthesis monooxygenase [Rhizomicrobium sp.]|nr:antibiotic biosynthesis monooxygenase [Rhizomicrobium sp.]